MSKRSRIPALLLVPCLLVDSTSQALASFQNPSSLGASTKSHFVNLYQTQSVNPPQVAGWESGALALGPVFAIRQDAGDDSDGPRGHQPSSPSSGGMWGGFKRLMGTDDETRSNKALAELTEAFKNSRSPLPLHFLRIQLERNSPQHLLSGRPEFDGPFQAWLQKHEKVIHEGQIFGWNITDFALLAWASAYPEPTPTAAPRDVYFEGKLLSPDAHGLVHIHTGEHNLLVVDPHRMQAYAFPGGAQSIAHLSAYEGKKIIFGRDPQIGKSPNVLTFASHADRMELEQGEISMYEGKIEIADGRRGVPSKHGTWPASPFADSRDAQRLLTTRAEKARLAALPDFVHSPVWQASVRDLANMTQGGPEAAENLIVGRLSLEQALGALNFREALSPRTLPFSRSSRIGESDPRLTWVENDLTPGQATFWETLIKARGYPATSLLLPIAAPEGMRIFMPRQLYLQLPLNERQALLDAARAILSTGGFPAALPTLAGVAQSVNRLNIQAKDPVNQLLKEARSSLLENEDWLNKKIMTTVFSAVNQALGLFAVAEPLDSESRGEAFPEMIEQPAVLLELLDILMQAFPDSTALHRLREALGNHEDLFAQRSALAHLLNRAMERGYLAYMPTATKAAFDAVSFDQSQDLYAHERGSYEERTIPFSRARLTLDDERTYEFTIGQNGLPLVQVFDTKTGRPIETRPIVPLGLGEYQDDAYDGVRLYHKEDGYSASRGRILLYVTQNEEGVFQLHYRPQRDYGWSHMRVQSTEPTAGVPSTRIFRNLAFINELLEDLPRSREHVNVQNVNDFKRRLIRLQENIPHINEAESLMVLETSAGQLYRDVLQFNMEVRENIAHAARRKAVLATRAKAREKRQANRISSRYEELRNIHPADLSRVGSLRKIEQEMSEFLHRYDRDLVLPGVMSEEIGHRIGRLRSAVHDHRERLADNAYYEKLKADFAQVNLDISAYLVRWEKAVAAYNLHHQLTELTGMLWDVRFSEKDAEFLNRTQAEREALHKAAEPLAQQLLAYQSDDDLTQVTAETADLRRRFDALFTGSNKPRPQRALPAYIRNRIQEMYRFSSVNDLISLFASNREQTARVVRPRDEVYRANKTVLQYREYLQGSVRSYLNEASEPSTYHNRLGEHFKSVEKWVRLAGEQVDDFKGLNKDIAIDRIALLQRIENNLKEFQEKVGPGYDFAEERALHATRPDLTDGAMDGRLAAFVSLAEAVVALRIWRQEGHTLPGLIADRNERERQTAWANSVALDANEKEKGWLIVREHLQKLLEQGGFRGDEDKLQDVRDGYYFTGILGKKDVFQRKGGSFRHEEFDAAMGHELSGILSLAFARYPSHRYPKQFLETAIGLIDALKLEQVAPVTEPVSVNGIFIFGRTQANQWIALVSPSIRPVPYGEEKYPAFYWIDLSAEGTPRNGDRIQEFQVPISPERVLEVVDAIGQAVKAKTLERATFSSDVPTTWDKKRFTISIHFGEDQGLNIIRNPRQVERPDIWNPLGKDYYLTIEQDFPSGRTIDFNSDTAIDTRYRRPLTLPGTYEAAKIWQRLGWKAFLTWWVAWTDAGRVGLENQAAWRTALKAPITAQEKAWAEQTFAKYYEFLPSALPGFWRRHDGPLDALMGAVSLGMLGSIWGGVSAAIYFYSHPALSSPALGLLAAAAAIVMGGLTNLSLHGWNNAGSPLQKRISEAA